MKEAGKQQLQQFQEEPALQPAMDVSPRQDAFTQKREPQPAFSQTPGMLLLTPPACHYVDSHNDSWAS